jgi:hypothetical protein
LRSVSIAQLVAVALATRSFTKIKLSAKFALPRQVPEWILHDLRRTATTVMADDDRLSIAPHVVDEILNHLAGAVFGVATIYNRNEYLKERRTALEAWAAMCWRYCSRRLL